MTGVMVLVNGEFDRGTQAAIVNFQRRVMRLPLPNGVIAPDDATFQQLAETMPQRLMAGAAGGLRLPPRTEVGLLQEDDYKAAAKKLNCEVRSIKAVTAVETPRGAFDERGRPTILFERHHFSRWTGRRYDKTHPNVSNRLPGGYGTYSSQYARLEQAFELDATAALKSTSWGAFQIMGENYIAAGFGTVDLFVTAMCQSMRQQLEAFVSFVKSNSALLKAIDEKKWVSFASIYNGKEYARNRYDTKLEEAYRNAQP
jgi:hypothetical protein